MMNKNDVVVITGASAGVGRACARAFAKLGCRVGLIARGIDGLNAAQAEIESLGGTAAIVSADVSNSEEIELAAEKIEAELGPIDVWINNATVTVFSRFKDITPEEFKRVTDVAYHGFVYGTQSALKRMIPRNRGTIVQVGSALAYRGIPLQSAYCGAKHAIQGFTESVRSELIHDEIDIYMTMVQLPALNTPQFTWNRSKMPRKPQPVPPIYQPELAAEAIVWCTYNKRREFYLGINTSVILWGNKFFPGFGDRYLAKNGFDSQMRIEPINEDRKDNLLEPLHGDFGAHGAFDSIAIRNSTHFELNKHKTPAILTGIAVAALAVFGFSKLFGKNGHNDQN